MQKKLLMAIKRQSIFITWLLSYVSILLIPIIISTIVYSKAGDIVENEVNRANGAVLKQVQQVMDSEMRIITELSRQIGLNPRNQGLLYSHPPLQEFQKFTLTQILQDFRIYKVSNSFIHTFYIFYKNFDLVVTDRSVYDRKLCYEVLHEDTGMSFEEWINLVNIPYINGFMPLTMKTDAGAPVKTVAYVQSLPLTDLRDSTATLMILLDTSQFQQAIRNIQWVNQGIVLIMDKNDNILVSTQELSLPPSLKYENLTASSGLSYDRLDGKEVVVSFVQSQITDWKYVSILPNTLFLEKVEYIRKLTIASFVLCLVLGGLVAFFFTKRNYSPVSQLVETIASKAGIPLDRTTRNEYLFIQKALSHTFDEKERINQKLKNQNVMLRTNFLMRMLKGRVGSDVPLFDTLSSFDIHFISDQFAVMLFYFEDYSRLFSEESRMDGEGELKMVQFILTNVVEELAGQNNQGYMSEVDEMMACLLNFKEPLPSGSIEEMLQIAQEAQQFMADHFGIYLSISISNIHRSLSAVPTAYQEAMEAMEYKMVMGNNRIIPYAQIKETIQSDSSYSYNLETEQQLINCIKVGDFEKAREMLHEVFEKSFRKNALSIDIAKCLMFDLVGTMMKTMDEIHIDLKSHFMEELSPARKLLGCETVFEMEEQMTGILKTVCDHVQVRKKSHNYQLRDSILAFIESNYQDENLSIAAMAESLQISLTYLSKFFKEQTGEGLLDYINRYRLEKAKKMLKEQSLSIGETAKKVGFYNSNALIRIFKKYEGITPGQFKEIS